ncbi:hypothetical protein ACQUQP_02255 [Marinobacterium sp. YM272]|uniref:hypothetical protein n=1 Tax=Marinobacterium sp. YM272 TaxID=3421654 RepID=UPI003D7FB757
MFKDLESVTFIENRNKYLGQVLGSEKDYFWLLVPELKNVYVGHPDRVFELDGVKYFSVFDHVRSVDSILEKNGNVASDFFCYSKDSEKMKKILKTLNLIFPM